MKKLLLTLLVLLPSVAIAIGGWQLLIVRRVDRYTVECVWVNSRTKEIVTEFHSGDCPVMPVRNH